MFTLYVGKAELFLPCTNWFFLALSFFFFIVTKFFGTVNFFSVVKKFPLLPLRKLKAACKSFFFFF